MGSICTCVPLTLMDDMTGSRWFAILWTQQNPTRKICKTTIQIGTALKLGLHPYTQQSTLYVFDYSSIQIPQELQ